MDIVRGDTVYIVGYGARRFMINEIGDTYVWITELDMEHENQTIGEMFAVNMDALRFTSPSEQICMCGVHKVYGTINTAHLHSDYCPLFNLGDNN